MSDVLAIVSKAVFEESAAGKQVGDVLKLDRYVSKNPALRALEGGGRLFLVTVRPPDEALWLVAALDSPRHDGQAWRAKPNALPIRDISALRPRIRFASGAGISAKAGALGMSLQTPRALAADDVALLLGETDTGAPAARPEAGSAPRKESPKARAAGVLQEILAPPTPALEPPPSGGGDGLLAELLARWAETRAPEYAALIDRLDATLPAAAGKTFQAALAKRSSHALRGLLAGLGDGVRFAEALARLEDVVALPPDPRVASFLVDLLEAPKFTAQSSRDFYRAIFDALADRHADPRAAERLAAIAPGYLTIFGATVMGESTQKRIVKLVAALRARFADRAPVDASDLAARVPAERPRELGGRRPASVEELVAAVWAEPDEEASYQVLADLLQERGDPRGELMGLALRFARTELTPKETARYKALLDKHHKAWFPELYEATYAKETQFFRGFPRVVHLRLLGGKLGRATNHPSWATVRELRVTTGGTKEHGANLLVQPAMRRLRVLRGVPYDVVEALAEKATEHQLEVLEIGWLPFIEDLGPGAWVDQVAARRFHPAWDKLLAGGALPRLRELHLHPEQVYAESLESFWDSPLARRLQALVVEAQYELDRALVAEARRRAPPKLDVHLRLRTAGIYLAHGGATIVQAFPDAWTSKDPRWSPLQRVLDHLPKELEGELGTIGFDAADVRRIAARVPRAHVRPV